MSNEKTIGDGVALFAIPHPPGLIDKMADAIQSGKLSLKKTDTTDMAETYTISSYSNFGYVVSGNGDIVCLDGSPYPDWAYVSSEHLAMARERKRRSQPKTIRVTCRSPKQQKN